MALSSRPAVTKTGFGHVTRHFHCSARRWFAPYGVRAQDDSLHTPPGSRSKLPPNPNNIRNGASRGLQSQGTHRNRPGHLNPASRSIGLEDVLDGEQQAASSEKHFFNPDLRRRMAAASVETPVNISPFSDQEETPSIGAETYSAPTLRRRGTKKNWPYNVTENGDSITKRTVPNQVGTFLDGQPEYYSPILLRDLCTCPSCLDASTKQKLFSTADIPSNIKARAVAQDASSISLLWENDVPGYGEDHATVLDFDVLRPLRDSGASPSADTGIQPGKQTIWDAQQYQKLPDIDYDEYMKDDATLFCALQQLHVYGMVFVRNVPDDAKSVSTIGERIGPIKNTFYGYTWDVRSVPEAKNVAYTSQDLGFHMDLLYMHQPPHLQLLHCIRSSAAGGASLFTDSYKAAADLFSKDLEAFVTLATSPSSFHYDHPEGHLYHQDHPVIKTGNLTFGFPTFKAFARVSQKLLSGDPRWMKSFDTHVLKGIRSFISREQKVEHYLQNVNWSPPFQAPIRIPRWRDDNGDRTPLPLLNDKATQWHRAAQKFSKLIHRQDGIYERMMRPGECVIFDNRRVLHARKAFEVGDAGKERWLRGTYLDWDPYWSKMRVLGRKFGGVHNSEGQ